MANAVTLTGIGQLTITETIDSALSPAATGSGLSRIFSNFNKVVQYLSGASPTLHGNVVDLSHTFASTGDKDWDLTAAPLARNTAQTVDLTGFKWAMGIMWVESGNASGVTVKGHATNGYHLWGASGQKIIYPGEHYTKLVITGSTLRTPAVAAGAKVIQLSGTDDDIFRAIMVFGS